MPNSPTSTEAEACRGKPLVSMPTSVLVPPMSTTTASFTPTTPVPIQKVIVVQLTVNGRRLIHYEIEWTSPDKKAAPRMLFVVPEANVNTGNLRACSTLKHITPYLQLLPKDRPLTTMKIHTKLIKFLSIWRVGSLLLIHLISVPSFWVRKKGHVRLTALRASSYDATVCWHRGLRLSLRIEAFSRSIKPRRPTRWERVKLAEG